jgi:hypothetical protein
MTHGNFQLMTKANEPVQRNLTGLTSERPTVIYTTQTNNKHHSSKASVSQLPIQVVDLCPFFPSP